MKNTSIKDSLKIRVPHTTGWFLLSCLLIFLLSSQFAQAAYWIGKYSGKQEEYRLSRQEKELRVEVEVLLQAGDKLTVLSKAGTLHLWKDDDDSEIVLNKENPVYTVPESKAPSGLISNLSAMLKEWVSQVSIEKVKSKSLSTRGDAPVLLLGASDWKNQLPQGFDSLVVYWSGGQPPFQVRLVDDDDKVITKKNNIQENNITLTNLDLSLGEYGLKVLGKSSSSFIELNVTENTSLPPIYTKILNSRAPKKIKQKYSVLFLASHSDWLFQSLQLAEIYGLTVIKQQILERDVPKAIDESQL